MQLRHVLATAAVTAVISPMALFTAPAAFATGDDASPTPAATTTTTTAPEQAASATADGGTSESATPSASTSTPAPASTSPTPSAKSKKSTKSATPSDASEPTCSGQQGDDRGRTSLRDLPSQIVAGSGWHAFTYRVTNESDVALKQTVISLYPGTADPDLDDIAQLGLTVQWRDPDTAEWVTIEGGDADPLANYDFAATTDLAPGEYADAEMRVQAGADAHAGDGYFFTNGYSYSADGQCGFDDITEYDFTVLAATSDENTGGTATGKPGKESDLPDDATKGTGTKSGNAPAPQGDHAAVPVSGRLAETGSPSALPTVAGVAAAAVVVGAGTLVVVRRRRAGSAG